MQIRQLVGVVVAHDAALGVDFVLMPADDLRGTAGDDVKGVALLGLPKDPLALLERKLAVGELGGELLDLCVVQPAEEVDL